MQSALPLEAASVPWSRSDVLTFTELVIDLHSHKVTGVPHLGTVFKCSDNQHLCMRGKTFNLVLPKSCSGYRYGQWSSSGLTTRVLKFDQSQEAQEHFSPKEPSLPEGLRTEVSLLATDGYPNVVFAVLQPIGIERVYLSVSPARDLRKLAEAGGVQALEASDALKFDRTGPSAMGACWGSLRFE